MFDPVITSDGHTYERESITEWLKAHNTSPKTGLALPNKTLTPNHDKRSDIAEFLQSHPEMYDQDILAQSEQLHLPQASKLALAAAIRGNQWEVIRQSIAHDRRLLRVALESDYRALHLAGMQGSPELAERLLGMLEPSLAVIDAGAFDARCMEAFTRPQNYRPVHFDALLATAVRDQSFDRAHILLALGADLEQRNAMGQSLLHQMLLQAAPKSTLEWLLQQGAVLDSVPVTGDTALHLAIQGGNDEVIEWLFGRYHLEPNVSNQAGFTCVALSVLQKNTRRMNLFLPPALRTLSPLFISIGLNDRLLMETLLHEDMSLCELRDAVGSTVLHEVVGKGNQELLTVLLSLPEVEPLINVSNQLGDTPLHVASALGQEAMALTLLAHGADVHAINDMGFTAVRVAKQTGYFDLAKQLEIAAWRLNRERDRVYKTLWEERERRAIAAAAAQPAVMFSALARRVAVLDEEKKDIVVEPAEVRKFLKHVAAGQQGLAEAMLKKNRDLAQVPGDVTDPADRTFRGITGFQYAVWALDYQMWTMIRKYLPDADAKSQLQGFEQGSWVDKHGMSANWQGLLDELKTYIDMPWNQEKCVDQWTHKVGGAQRQLPMHVLQEYCEPSRPFDPCPNFKANYELKRELPDWLVAGDGSLVKGLSTDFGIFRGCLWRAECARVGGSATYVREGSMSSMFDRLSLTTLFDTRTDQLRDLAVELGLAAIAASKPRAS
jgi:ankyrin repeat protein